MTLGAATALFEVSDMNAALDHYRALGFVAIDRSPEIVDGGERYSHWCWLRRDGAELMLNTAYETIAERPAAPEAAAKRACLFIGCDDVDALHAEFVARGVTCGAPKDAPYGMRQLYLTDPDGFGLCFQQRIAA